MTIQIDDAGWGSLVGPTFIGAYRPETGEFTYGTVGIDFFQGKAFTQKRYLQETTNVIRELLDRLEAEQAEPIEMCSGSIFDHARRHLRRKVSEEKITGRLQHLIEQVATDHLADLGIPIRGVGPGARHFMICLNWVAQDLRGRERFCKTGWKSWHRK